MPKLHVNQKNQKKIELTFSQSSATQRIIRIAGVENDRHIVTTQKTKQIITEGSLPAFFAGVVGRTPWSARVPPDPLFTGAADARLGGARTLRAASTFLSTPRSTAKSGQSKPAHSVATRRPRLLDHHLRRVRVGIDNHAKPADHHLFPALVAPPHLHVRDSGLSGLFAELSKCAVHSIRVPFGSSIGFASS